MSDIYLTREQSRRYDQLAIELYRVPSIVLMENAARNCVDVIQQVGLSGPVVVVCGRGNNAGDGFAMARHLQLRHHEVLVVETDETHQYTPDAASNREILAASGYRFRELGELESVLADAEWCVDALLGTGARGEPRPPLNAVVQQLNAAHCQRFAVDVPTGFDCDSGAVASSVFLADHTCTFVARKLGMRQDGALACCGAVHVVDVGAPDEVLVTLLRETGADAAQ